MGKCHAIYMKVYNKHDDEVNSRGIKNAYHLFVYILNSFTEI